MCLEERKPFPNEHKYATDLLSIILRDNSHRGEYRLAVTLVGCLFVAHNRNPTQPAFRKTAIYEKSRFPIWL